MYRIFDIALDSQLPLPELVEVTGPDNPLRIMLEPNAIHPASLPSVWQHEFHDPEGTLAIQTASTGNQYVLRFPDICDFIISLEEGRVTCVPQADIPHESVRHLLLDQVVPRVLGQNGNLVLHASAVMLDDDSVLAFVGDSGWGKSTLASAFYHGGYRLLTDDCLLLKPGASSVDCVPNYYGLRLYRDSADAVFGSEAVHGVAVAHYTDKQRHLYGSESNEQQPEQAGLAAIFLLNNPEDSPAAGMVEIEPVKGAGEVMAIIKQMFVLDPTDTALTIKQFRLAASLVASQVPIFRLSYAREYLHLPEVMQTILNSLELD